MDLRYPESTRLSVRYILRYIDYYAVRYPATFQFASISNIPKIPPDTLLLSIQPVGMISAINTRSIDLPLYYHAY
jgi:hypothetical protein